MSSSTCATIPDALTAVRNPAVRAAALMCSSVSLCVEHVMAARGPFELQDAMKLFFFAALFCRPRLAFETPARSHARVSPDAKTRGQCILGGRAHGLPTKSATCQLHFQRAPRFLSPLQGSAQAVLERSCGSGKSATSTVASLQHTVPFPSGRCGHPRKKYLSSSAQ